MILAVLPKLVTKTKQEMEYISYKGQSQIASNIQTLTWGWALRGTHRRS